MICRVGRVVQRNTVPAGGKGDGIPAPRRLGDGQAFKVSTPADESRTGVTESGSKIRRRLPFVTAIRRSVRSLILPRPGRPRPAPRTPDTATMTDRRTRANAIRALSMDAVQQANSGHPRRAHGHGRPRRGPLARPPRPQPGQPSLGESRPLRAVQRPRLDAPVLAPAPVGLRPADRGADELPPAALEDPGAPRARAHARRRDDDGAARAGAGQRRRHGARRAHARRPVQP